MTILEAAAPAVNLVPPAVALGGGVTALEAAHRTNLMVGLVTVLESAAPAVNLVALVVAMGDV